MIRVVVVVVVVVVAVVVVTTLCKGSPVCVHTCVQPVLGGLAGFFGNSQERFFRLLQTVLSRSNFSVRKLQAHRQTNGKHPTFFMLL